MELLAAEDDDAAEAEPELLSVPFDVLFDVLFPHPARLAATSPAAANTAQNFFVFFIINSPHVLVFFIFRSGRAPAA